MSEPWISRYVTLDKDRANELYALVEEAGLDTRDFQLIPHPESDADILVYRPEERFRLAFVPNGIANSRPGRDDVLTNAETWALQRADVTDWLAAVVAWRDSFNYQTDLRDLWADQEADLTADADVVALTETARDDPFTTEERLVVAEALAALREALRESVSPEELELVERRLRYLEAAAQTQGRRDWLLMLIGTLFTVGVEAALPPDSVRGLFRVVFIALQGLFGDAPPSLIAGS